MLTVAGLCTVLDGPLSAKEKPDNYLSPSNYAQGFRSIAKLYSYGRSGHKYEARKEYPAFIVAHPLEKFATRQLESIQRRHFWEWVFHYREEQRDMPDQSLMDYWFDSRPELRYYSPGKRISVRFNEAEFTGYLHPLARAQNYNFVLLKGKPHQLALKDLFHSGFKYHRFLELALFKKLTKYPHAGHIGQDGVLHLDDAVLNNFCFARGGGMAWFLNEYEAGSYADGTAEVTLTSKELGPNFNRELLTG